MKAHPRFPGFSEQRGRIPMTQFARDPVRCSPASLALARPYSPTNFIPTPLAITSMKCASFQKFLYKNKHIQIHLFFSPQLESPHTHPSTEVFLSSLSLDTEIKCPLFNCVILLSIAWLLALHSVLAIALLMDTSAFSSFLPSWTTCSLYLYLCTVAQEGL